MKLQEEVVKFIETEECFFLRPFGLFVSSDMLLSREMIDISLVHNSKKKKIEEIFQVNM